MTERKDQVLAPRLPGSSPRRSIAELSERLDESARLEQVVRERLGRVR